MVLNWFFVASFFSFSAETHFDSVCFYLFFANKLNYWKIHRFGCSLLQEKVHTNTTNRNNVYNIPSAVLFMNSVRMPLRLHCKFFLFFFFSFTVLAKIVILITWKSFLKQQIHRSMVICNEKSTQTIITLCVSVCIDKFISGFQSICKIDKHWYLLFICLIWKFVGTVSSYLFLIFAHRLTSTMACFQHTIPHRTFIVIEINVFLFLGFCLAYFVNICSVY